MTPLQKLNYRYSALRWAVVRSLAPATHVLNKWSYPHTANALNTIKDNILNTIKAQYEHDKRVLQAKLNKTDKPT